jgi:hypothetical protein
MDYYVIGLGITVITMLISISICACCCKTNGCEYNKKEKIPLLYTSIQTGNDGTEIIVSV